MKVWLQLVIFVILSPGMLQSASLRIFTENLPPLNYVKDGALVGPSVEMVKEIQRRIGSTEEIKVYPWARAYQIALEEENVLLFGMSHTADRENKFKWVGPLATKSEIHRPQRSCRNGDWNGGLEVFTDAVNGPGYWKKLPESAKQIRRDNGHQL